MSNIEYELNEKIHAIIINPYLKWNDFCDNCYLIKKFNIKNISTTFNYLTDLRNKLSDHSSNINTLISYPFADLPISFIEELVFLAKEKGANGIEYMPNFLNLSKSDFNNFAAEIEKVKAPGLPVTIILNKSKLEKEFFNNAIDICLELGVKNFQLGDGFGPPITTYDVIEILKILKNENLVKVVGGIKKLSEVINMLDSGITCVGTSNFYEIFQEVKFS
tara:strand:- start:3 stop:662 length:660 start_codon:yes stop_codon:yes gene_type:complete